MLEISATVKPRYHSLDPRVQTRPVFACLVAATHLRGTPNKAEIFFLKKKKKEKVNFLG